MADIEPRQGTPDTLAQRLRDYLAPHDADLVARWRGASEATLHEYAALAGFGQPSALPAAYRSYAVELGADDGGLLADFKIDARVHEVVGLYRDCLRSEPDSLDPDLPVCGFFVIGDQISFDRREAADEPAIVQTSDGEWFADLSRDWEALAMQAAILRVEPRRLPHARWLSCTAVGLEKALAGDRSPARVAQAIDEFAAPFGLALAWSSDPRHHVLLGGSRSLYARIGAEGGLLLYAFAMDDTFLRAVGDALAPVLGAATGGVAGIVDGTLRDIRR